MSKIDEAEIILNLKNNDWSGAGMVENVETCNKICKRMSIIS